VKGSAKCSPTAVFSVFDRLDTSAFCFNPFIDKEETLFKPSIFGGKFC